MKGQSVALIAAFLALAETDTSWAFVQPSSLRTGINTPLSHAPSTTRVYPLSARPDSVPGIGAGEDEVSVRFVYDKWRAKYGRGGTFDQRRYEIFKVNYFASKQAHQAAVRRALQESQPPPPPFPLNQYADLNPEEFKAMKGAQGQTTAKPAAAAAEVQMQPSRWSRAPIVKADLSSPRMHPPAPRTAADSFKRTAVDSFKYNVAERAREQPAKPKTKGPKALSPPTTTDATSRTSGQEQRKRPPRKGFQVDLTYLQGDIHLTKRNRIRNVYIAYCSHYGKNIDEARLDMFATRLLTFLKVQKERLRKGMPTVTLNGYADLTPEEFQAMAAPAKPPPASQDSTKPTQATVSPTGIKPTVETSPVAESAIPDGGISVEDTAERREVVDEVAFKAKAQEQASALEEAEDCSKTANATDLSQKSSELFQRGLLQEKLKIDSEKSQRESLDQIGRLDEGSRLAESKESKIGDDLGPEEDDQIETALRKKRELFHQSMLLRKAENDKVADETTSKEEDKRVKAIEAAARQSAWKESKQKADEQQSRRNQQAGFEEQGPEKVARTAAETRGRRKFLSQAEVDEAQRQEAIRRQRQLEGVRLLAEEKAAEIALEVEQEARRKYVQAVVVRKQQVEQEKTQVEEGENRRQLVMKRQQQEEESRLMQAHEAETARLQAGQTVRQKFEEALVQRKQEVEEDSIQTELDESRREIVIKHQRHEEKARLRTEEEAAKASRIKTAEEAHLKFTQAVIDRKRESQGETTQAEGDERRREVIVKRQRQEKARFDTEEKATKEAQIEGELEARRTFDQAVIHRQQEVQEEKIQAELSEDRRQVVIERQHREGEVRLKAEEAAAETARIEAEQEDRRRKLSQSVIDRKREVEEERVQTEQDEGRRQAVIDRLWQKNETLLRAKRDATELAREKAEQDALLKIEQEAVESARLQSKKEAAAKNEALKLANQKAQEAADTKKEADAMKIQAEREAAAIIEAERELAMKLEELKILKEEQTQLRKEAEAARKIAEAEARWRADKQEKLKGNKSLSIDDDQVVSNVARNSPQDGVNYNIQIPDSVSSGKTDSTGGEQRHEKSRNQAPPSDVDISTTSTTTKAAYNVPSPEELGQRKKSLVRPVSTTKAELKQSAGMETVSSAERADDAASQLGGMKPETVARLQAEEDLFARSSGATRLQFDALSKQKAVEVTSFGLLQTELRKGAADETDLKRQFKALEEDRLKVRTLLQVEEKEEKTPARAAPERELFQRKLLAQRLENEIMAALFEEEKAATMEGPDSNSVKQHLPLDLAAVDSQSIVDITKEESPVQSTDVITEYSRLDDKGAKQAENPSDDVIVDTIGAALLLDKDVLITSDPSIGMADIDESLQDGVAPRKEETTRAMGDSRTFESTESSIQTKAQELFRRSLLTMQLRYDAQETEQKRQAKILRREDELPIEAEEETRIDQERITEEERASALKESPEEEVPGEWAEDSPEESPFEEEALSNQSAELEVENIKLGPDPAKGSMNTVYWAERVAGEDASSMSKPKKAVLSKDQPVEPFWAEKISQTGNADSADTKNSKAASDNAYIQNLLSSEFLEEELAMLSSILPELGDLMSSSTRSELAPADPKTSDSPFLVANFPWDISSSSKEEATKKPTSSEPKSIETDSWTVDKLSELIANLSESVKSIGKVPKAADPQGIDDRTLFYLDDRVDEQQDFVKETLRVAETEPLPKVDSTPVAEELAISSKEVIDSEDSDGEPIVADASQIERDPDSSIINRLSSLLGMPSTNEVDFSIFNQPLFGGKDEKTEPPMDADEMEQAPLTPQKPKQEPAFSNIPLAAPRVSWFERVKGTVSKANPASESSDQMINVNTLPTLSTWTKNTDGSITGVIDNSNGFESGTEIRTAPVKATSDSGDVVTTVSGSRYLLLGNGQIAEPDDADEDSFKDDSPFLFAPGFELGDNIDPLQAAKSLVALKSLFGRNKLEIEAVSARVEELAENGILDPDRGTKLSFPSVFGRKPKAQASEKSQMSDLAQSVEQEKSSKTPYNTLFGKKDRVGKQSAAETSQISDLTQSVGPEKTSKTPFSTLFQKKDKVDVPEKEATSTTGGFFNNKKAKGKAQVDMGAAVLSDWEQNPDGSITGIVSNREGFQDGSWITTSQVKAKARAGRTITTIGGSKYKLK